MDMADKHPGKKGRTGASSSASESRKLRNRLSQKAFRARQSLYIKELEKRLEWSKKSGVEPNAELEEANRELRARLLDCYKKLESMQVTLKTLSDSVAIALGIEGNNASPHNLTHGEGDEASVPPSASAPSSLQGAWSPDNYLSPSPSAVNLQGQELIDAETVLGTEPPQQPPGNVAWRPGNETWNQLGPQISVSYQQMMGPLQYRHLSGSGPVLLHDQDFHLCRTNSTFSDHITVCESLLRQKWLQSGACMSGRDDCLINSVYFMLSTFICLAWPTMTSWHTHTRAHIPVAKIITWHVNPTPLTYADLGAAGSAWLPTQLQLSVPHPAIIDWIPFPALRDKLILYHSANPRLDDIICDIGNSYVMEADISTFVAGVGSLRGYISVWDLVRAISPKTTDSSSGGTDANIVELNNALGTDSTWAHGNRGSNCQAEQGKGLGCSFPTLPAPSVDVLFNSNTLAFQAFKMLNMDKGPWRFKLDPAFFERHPELYDPKTDLMAHGLPLRPSTRKSIEIPRPLDDSVLGRYCELVSWNFDLGLGRSS